MDQTFPSSYYSIMIFILMTISMATIVQHDLVYYASFILGCMMFKVTLGSMCQLMPIQVSLSQNSGFSSFSFQRFGFSSASPETKEKENENAVENNGAESGKPNEEVNASEEPKESGSSSETQQSVKRRRSGTKRTAFSDSDSESESESELSREELVKRLAEKEELLKAKHQEIENMKDKVLRSYAEMENVKDRTRREAENSKKFAIQVSFYTIFSKVIFVFICTGVLICQPLGLRNQN